MPVQMTLGEVRELLIRYTTALHWDSLAWEDIQIKSGHVYKGKYQEKCEAGNIWLHNVGISIYPSYTEQSGVFGKTLQFAWTAEKVFLNGDPATIIKTPNAGLACQAVIRAIMEMELENITNELATEGMAVEHWQARNTV